MAALVMNRLIVLFFLGCGTSQQLKVACTEDNNCNKGEICSNALCTAVNADDLSTWPKPKDSAELLERLGVSDLLVGSTPQSSFSLVVSDPEATTSVAWPLTVGTADIKVSGGQITVWNLSFHGDGGSVDSAAVDVENLTLTASAPVVLPIVVDAYPKAHATGVVTLLLAADVGSSPTDLSRVNATLVNMPLTLAFDLEQGAVSAALSLGDSRALIDFGSAFRLGALNVTARLVGEPVPSSWE